MSRTRQIRRSVVVAGSTILTLASLSGMTDDARVFVDSAGVIVVLVAIGAALRVARMRAWAIHTVQAVVLLGALVGSASMGAYRPGFQGMIRLAAQQFRTEAPPLSTTAGARWALVALIGVLAIVIDLLVDSLRAPAWAIIPLTGMYLIPLFTLDTGLPWWQFAALTVAYLALLTTETITREEEWTRGVGADSWKPPRLHGGVWRAAAWIGVPALVLALVVGSVAPRFGRAPSIGTRSGGGPIQMQDPTLDLTRDLNESDPRPVLSYTTSDGQGVYLRMAALTVVGASGWKMPSVSLTTGSLPDSPGAAVATSKLTTSVTIGSFDSEYLPAPYAPKTIDASGQWAHDDGTLMILSIADSGRRQATRNLSYRVVSDVVTPDADQFSTAMAGTPVLEAATVSDVPSDVPKSIVDLTEKITRGAPSDAIKAARIQAYLTDPKVFTYDTTAPAGSGYEVLENFLFKSHSGYCIHFAAAMALMARIAGIPSRVAVGFTPGTKVGDHYEVTTRNAHAWPELYFADYGWVRYEPTVAVAAAPDWTTVTNPVSPSAQPTESATVATNAPTDAASASRRAATPTASAPAGASADGTAGIEWGLVLRWVVGVLIVAAIVCAPMLTRMGLRRRRLSPKRPDADRIDGAWDEVAALARDLGRLWPAGSPASAAARLGERSSAPAAAALARLAHWVELRRYARSLPAGAEVAGDVAVVRSQWRADASVGRRLAALLLPASLAHRPRRTTLPDPRERAGGSTQTTGRPDLEPTGPLSDAGPLEARQDVAHRAAHAAEEPDEPPGEWPDEPGEWHPRHAG